ncbi:hypothetical protein LRS58_12075 [Rhodococcus sp. BH2-1]|nr:hypothetical protein [Rhodococcus sp. BH2-1]
MKDDYLDNMGREEAEELLAQFEAGNLTQEQVRDGLAKVWGTAARPGVLLTPKQWRDLWHFAGHIHLYRETPNGPIMWKETARPSAGIRLYRCSDAAFRANPSWTESEYQARYWLDGDTVWVAEFAPERLLATVAIQPNGETEYIAYAEDLDLRIYRRLM